MINKIIKILKGFANAYSWAYIYAMWFLDRKMKSSFKTLDWFSNIQISIAPIIPSACYFMVIFLMVDSFLPHRMPDWAAYSIFVVSLLVMVLATFRWTNRTFVLEQYHKFESFSPSKRKKLDLLTGAILICAIPSLFLAAAMLRDRS